MRGCQHHQHHPRAPQHPADSGPLDRVTLSEVPPLPRGEVLARTAMQTALFTLASSGGWHDAAVCPICMFDGACRKELGHSGQHRCNQGHNWG